VHSVHVFELQPFRCHLFPASSANYSSKHFFQNCAKSVEPTRNETVIIYLRLYVYDYITCILYSFSGLNMIK
jgi:hypothetical protein